MKIACPRCNSKQNFVEKVRSATEGESEVYIKCNLCKWEKVVFSGKSSKIKQYKELSRLKVKYKNDPGLKKLLQLKLKKLNEKTNT
jgi:ribosomal protein S27E